MIKPLFQAVAAGNSDFCLFDLRQSNKNTSGAALERGLPRLYCVEDESRKSLTGERKAEGVQARILTSKATGAKPRAVTGVSLWFSL